MSDKVQLVVIPSLGSLAPVRVLFDRDGDKLKSIGHSLDILELSRDLARIPYDQSGPFVG